MKIVSLLFCYLYMALRGIQVGDSLRKISQLKDELETLVNSYKSQNAYLIEENVKLNTTISEFRHRTQVTAREMGHLKQENQRLTQELGRTTHEYQVDKVKFDKASKIFEAIQADSHALNSGAVDANLSGLRISQLRL